jgi:chorismate lyase/3-hydroxybenzoate synthase
MRPAAPVATAPFLVDFTGAAAIGPQSGARLRLKVLAGEPHENIFPSIQPAGACGAFSLFASDEWLLGSATSEPGMGIEAVARGLYGDLLDAARDFHLCRIWNYVPHINAHSGGIENYRAFCRGRAMAFEAQQGPRYFERLCAASAVGTTQAELTVIFAATKERPTHHENPDQVPAYRYPQEHGPRAPSFARATVCRGGRTVFISGTAAIKGHATIAPDDTAAQVECTLENLALISQTAGIGADLGAGRSWRRHFKIYLRHAADLPATAARLQNTLLRPGDHVTWLQADICRAALNVEIEATLSD